MTTHTDSSDLLEVCNHDLTSHVCRPFSPHNGYKHSTQTCLGDLNGRLWLLDVSGRHQTQAKFCPFCGLQALNTTTPDKAEQVTPADVALVPNDKPQRVWKHYQNPVSMRHFMFGTVKLLASDGCHAKVLTEARVQLTVCVENLRDMADGVVQLPAKRDKSNTVPREVKQQIEISSLVAKLLNKTNQ